MGKEIEYLHLERTKLQAELIRLTTLLTKTKFGKRAPIRKAIRKIKDELERVDRMIKKADKEETITTLAEKGIDSRGNIVKDITAGVTSVANSAFGATGVFGSGGVFSQGRANVIDAKKRGVDETAQSSFIAKYGLLIGIGIFVLYLLVKGK